MKPRSYYALSPAKIARNISEQYGWPKVKCSLIVQGVGDTYLIETLADRFILRVYRKSHRNLQQIQAEVSLLLALKEARVSVSYPVAGKSGEFILKIKAAEGIRHAVLFTYAPGEVVNRLNKNQLRDLGHQVAQFHNVSSIINPVNNRWEYNLDTTLFEPLKTLYPYFENNSEGYEWLMAAAKKAEQKLSKLDTSAFSKGYCHFDFLPKNFHFEGDKVTLFDFDFLGYGWLVNDVMTFWQHLCLDVHFNKITQEEADEAYRIFISAYREKRALTDDELAAVPYLSLGFWLFYSAFHATHERFHIYLESANLKLRVDRIRQLMERYWAD